MTEKMIAVVVAILMCCFLSGFMGFWIEYFLGRKEIKEK